MLQCFLFFSLGQVQLWLGLLGLADSEQGGGLVLVVEKGVDFNVGNSLNFLVGKHIIDVLVERGSADSVEVLSNGDFLVGDTAELAIDKSHVHSVVDVRPLGSVIELGAVVSVSVHEVAGLLEVVEEEFFAHGAILAGSPAST